MDCQQPTHDFHYYVMAAAGLAHSVLEFLLGKSKKIKANSVLELLLNTGKLIFSRKEKRMSKAVRTVEYEKEIDDAMVLVVTLLADLKAKKSLAEIGADVLPKLKDAVEAVSGIAGDFKEDRHEALETVGFRLGDLVDALLEPEPVAVAPAQPTPPPAA